MKFFDCKTAPSPRRARIFIAEKCITVETVPVDLRSKEQLDPDFRSINPHCTVPVLELDDGTRLTTTAGIWRYLEAAYPDPALMGETPKQRGIISDLQWHIEMNGFMAMSEFLRNSAPALKGRALTGPHDYEQISELADRGKLRGQRFLEEIDQIIANKLYAAGDQFSVADIDLLVFIDFAAWRKLNFPEGAENTRRWYENVRARRSTQL